MGPLSLGNGKGEAVRPHPGNEPNEFLTCLRGGQERGFEGEYLFEEEGS